MDLMLGSHHKGMHSKHWCTLVEQKVTYVCGDALSSLWDFREGIIDGGDIGDD